MCMWCYLTGNAQTDSSQNKEQYIIGETIKRSIILGTMHKLILVEMQYNQLSMNK